jgi:hypothetical protein
LAERGKAGQGNPGFCEWLLEDGWLPRYADENAHAPNERLDLGNFHNGIVASAVLYDEISKTR